MAPDRTRAAAGAPTSTLQPSYLGAFVGAPLPVFDRDTLPPAAFKRRVWKADSLAERKDAGTCHVRGARSGCRLDVCALPAPATSFARAGGSPRCGLVRRIRSVAHASELPA